MNEAENRGGIESLLSQTPPQPHNHPQRDLGREHYDAHEIIGDIKAGAKPGEIVERYTSVEKIKQLPIDDETKEDLVSMVESDARTLASLLISGHKQLIGAEHLLEEERSAHSKTKDKSSIDFLTGLPLREKMDNETIRELTKLRRKTVTDTPKLSYMMFDIDKFKNINDTYGHSAGDLVLTEFAKLLKDIKIPGYDKSIFVARYGGEEFAGIARAYPDIPKHLEAIASKKENKSQIVTGRSIAEKIRSAVQEHKFVYNDGTKEITIPVTMSIGVSGYDPLQDSNVSDLDDLKNTLKKRADDALYSAKENGRNMVIVHGDRPENNFGQSTERYGLLDSLKIGYKAAKAAFGSRRK